MTDRAVECRFTLRHYREILHQARALDFEILRLADAARLEAGRRQMILRHDVDFSVEDALRMAVLESELGVAATYCILLHSPTYCLGDAETLASVRAIQSLGHEIALHYDLAWFEEAGIAPREGIQMEAAWLSRMLATPIRSVAQHRPATQGRVEGVTKGFIDAYDDTLTRDILYLSDSRHRWRQGCVHEHLATATQLQLLVHPLWWDPELERNRREIVARVAQARQRHIATVMEEYCNSMERV